MMEPIATRAAIFCRWLVILFILTGLFFPASMNAQLLQKKEAFDQDPSWDSLRNRVVLDPVQKQQDYGYKTTNYAGGSPGEMGGVIWRTITPSYYGKIVGPFTFEDSLAASGRIAVRKAKTRFGWQTGSTVFIGFFNHAGQGWRPINFIGFRLETHTDTEAAEIESRPGIEICYGTSQWTAGGAHVNTSGEAQERNVRQLDQDAMRRIPPDGSQHTWEILYNSKGGNGAGELTVSIDGIKTSISLQRHHRLQGATFDRFGIFNNQLPGQEIEAYFDDLIINGEKEDLSTDPHWDGKGNTDLVVDSQEYGSQDYGFTPTAFAGGKPGELGGRFFSVDPWDTRFQGYYGDKTGQLSFNDRLTAKGKFAAPTFSIDSTFALGWFNSEERGWPLKNFIGVYFDSVTDIGRIVQPMYATSDRTVNRGGGSVTFRPDGTSYEWLLEYDPAAADGAGAIRFSMNGQTATLPLADGDRARKAECNRFGVFNLSWANSKYCNVYLDDLEYTVNAMDQNKSGQ